MLQFGNHMLHSPAGRPVAGGRWCTIIIHLGIAGICVLCVVCVLEVVYLGVRGVHLPMKKGSIEGGDRFF